MERKGLSQTFAYIYLYFHSANPTNLIRLQVLVPDLQWYFMHHMAKRRKKWL